jgi:two-component system, chemotaxis family, CheB/CheR fusion protein
MGAHIGHPPATESPALAGLRAVVGLGASAGGLEPLHAVLRSFPLGQGICFIVVQHLAPTHPSALPALLQSGTAQRVLEARDTQALEPDTVYVIAPGTSLSVAGGHLRVAALAPELHVPPNLIDVHFRSLADAYGPRAVSVVLSDMGSDGSAGLRCIVEHGGLGPVQTPQSARFDSMPNHAADIGHGVRVGGISTMAAQIPAVAGTYTKESPAPPGPGVGPRLFAIQAQRHPAPRIAARRCFLPG